MPEAKLKVEMLAFTPKPGETAATAAHMCYAGIDIEKLKQKVSPEYAKKLLKRLTEEGHMSPLEHASFTFAIEGISRACSHQLVRHRIASFSQQSQRYVKETGFNFIVPPKVKSNENSLKKFNESMGQSEKAYEELLKEVPAEDARFVLPNACETRIIVTMNTRSLYNFFERRLCVRAQWEIRCLAEAMFKLCKEAAPLLFEACGPICDRLGYCPERETCGRKPLRKDAIKG
ncbi:MAG: FAD-dependent thymidylate synthase [Candidatus Diapherotrites archaeon]|uniref:Flavin-dependent thymidylate synthase n=1 Tax=Candidatus Iainarchaeum sp. TaxID=3101447 RepID=A0A938YQ81_9ARCH|nr:FAD-dependent thymidylate synthase [Candidatus Diapherotrites archaeon]